MGVSFEINVGGQFKEGKVVVGSRVVVAGVVLDFNHVEADRVGLRGVVVVVFPYEDLETGSGFASGAMSSGEDPSVADQGTSTPDTGAAL